MWVRKPDGNLFNVEAAIEIKKGERKVAAHKFQADPPVHYLVLADIGDEEDVVIFDSVSLEAREKFHGRLLKAIITNKELV